MWRKRLNFERRFVAQFRVPENDGGAGGDGGSKGGTGGNAGGGSAGGQKDGGDLAAQLAAANARIAELEKGQKAPPKKEEDDPELQERARRTREAADKDSARTKQLENALKFNLKSAEFLKQNESLLPKEVSDIFSQAEKENFADAIEKDSAIKSGLVQSFFAVQANVDLLTAGQKATLDEYLKLTKNEKQNRAQAIYDMVFEPAFEMLKRVKRAEALSKGYGGGSDAETAYKAKLMASTRKHYLGEK